MAIGEWHPHITVTVNGDGLNAEQIANLVAIREARAKGQRTPPSAFRKPWWSRTLRWYFVTPVCTPFSVMAGFTVSWLLR